MVRRDIALSHGMGDRSEEHRLWTSKGRGLPWQRVVWRS